MSKFIPELVSMLMPIKNKERHNFSAKDKDEVVRKQRGRCAICTVRMNRWERDFHHKNGNKSNNKLSNCSAVHTRCHRKKHAELGKNRQHGHLLNLIMGRWSI